MIFPSMHMNRLNIYFVIFIRLCWLLFQSFLCYCQSVKVNVIDRTSTSVESCHSGRPSLCPLTCKRRHNWRQPDTSRWSGRSGNRILWAGKGSVKIKTITTKLYSVDTEMCFVHSTKNDISADEKFDFIL